MNKKTLTIIALSALLALSGCSGSGSSLPEKEDDAQKNITSQEASENPSAQENSEENDVFSESATRLSVSDGNLNISRRSPSATGNTKDNEYDWTLLVYLCGTDLESNYGAASTDLYEAISAEYSENVRIVYQTGGTSQWAVGISNETIQRYENVEGDISLVEELPSESMGNADNLASFVAWGLEKYPADKTGLIFWNHGSGSINGVCFDELYDKDSLSLKEIDSALNSVYDSMTDKFEFIGFDACLMSTLETANILVPYAKYMFASEETEPGGGWNYTDIMNFLAENPEADGAELGKMQCESYYQHCIDNGDSEGTTFAITDLSKLDELLVSFNNTAKEIYESESSADIIRAIQKADNFGGNNRNEGYTNMVDLKGLLNSAAPYISNAEDTLEKLDNAVISVVNGPQHEGAGGLSLYYPLSVQGSDELSTFADVCTSTYYLAFVDRVAYGNSSDDYESYDNSYISQDCQNIWDCGYSGAENIDGSSENYDFDSESSYIEIGNVYFDENGTYTVPVINGDYFSYATCSLFAEFDGASVYLGEDDNVIIDGENMLIQDNFDGSWPALEGYPLAIEAVSLTDDMTVYTCPIRLNGEDTNLRIEYHYSDNSWKVLGAWDGIDPETGAAAKETIRLKAGDVIAPLYLAIYDEDYEYIEAGEFVLDGEPEIEYLTLFDGDFSYSMTLYDIFGNYTYTPAVTFEIDENGDVYFDSEEL